jgi:hypothetical protein
MGLYHTYERDHRCYQLELYRAILSQRWKSGSPSILAPNKERHFHPVP